MSKYEIGFPFLLIVSIVLSLTVTAQPEYTNAELKQFGIERRVTRGMKYGVPQERFPMPEIQRGSLGSTADGGIDLSFNAAVSEGFGYVNDTVVQPDGKIVVVGLFQRANGIRTNGIARLNPDGSLDMSFHLGGGANAAIRSVALQSDGKIVIGGAFTQFNGQTVSRIVRLEADGEVDLTFSINVALGGQINDVLVLPNGKIMIGGAFNLSTSRLARLNTDGTLETSAFSVSGTVHSIESAPGDKFLVGGQFGSPRRNVARFENSGSLDATFVPPSGSGSGNPVLRVASQPDGKVIAAGVFGTFNGETTDGLVRLTNTGTNDATFELTADPNAAFFLNVTGIEVQPDGKFLVGFFNDDSEFVADVRRFNPDASQDLTFNSNTNNSLLTTNLNLLSDGSMLVCGYFSTVNDVQRLKLVKLNSSGALDTAFQPALSSAAAVYVIERQIDGKILIGGDFEYVNGQQRSGIARLHSDGSLDTSFKIGTGFYGDVYAIREMPNGTIVIGGLFSGGPNFPAYSLARINQNGSFANSFDLGTGFLNYVYTIERQSSGGIIVGGAIYNGASEAFGIVRLLDSNSFDPTFLPPKISDSGYIRDLLIQPDDKIVYVGAFSSGTGATFRNGIGRLNANGVLDSGFSANAGQAYTITEQAGGVLYVGGTTLQKYSSDGVIDPGFNIGTGFSDVIRDIEVQPNGKLIVAGRFLNYNGTSVNHLVRLANTGAIDPTFSTAGPDGHLFAISLLPDGRLEVGGEFLDFAGSVRFSIVRLNNSLRRTKFDFDGDSKADFAVYRPAGGDWWRLNSGTNYATYSVTQFGINTDQIVPADYTGDGKTDLAIWRPGTGEWYVLRSEDGSYYSLQWGASGDIPVPGDFDGDGKSDIAVYRPSQGVWYILQSTAGVRVEGFGISTDKPVVGDYDGDGKDDIAIFRPSTGDWWIGRSTAGLIVLQFGTQGDKTAQGDFTGDGKTDLAVFRPSDTVWYIMRSEDLSFYGYQFGIPTDVPVSADYDGDGKADIGVYRPSTGQWWVVQSTNGITNVTWGNSTDVPIPSAFVRQ